MDIVLVAFIAAVVGPAVLAVVNQLLGRAAKREDWARQDAVAQHVADAAEQARKAASLLVEENRRSALASARTDKKIDAVASQASELQSQAAEIQTQAAEIHGLVNSAMSEEMRRNLESQEALLVVLEELAEVKIAAGLAPSSDAEARVNATRAMIVELRAALGDRQRAATTKG